MSYDQLVTSARMGGRVHAARINAAGDGFELACDRQQPELLDVVSAEDGWQVSCRSCTLALRDKLQRRHESPDVAGMARRGIRALVNRAAEGDTIALTELVALQDVLQEAITTAGQVLHHGHGYSYTLLANELGISRQGARQRFMRYETTSDTLDKSAQRALQAAGA